jgi:hypothetical protein
VEFENTMAQQYRSEPAVANFNRSATAYSQLVNEAKKGTGANDQALLNAATTLINPGVVGANGQIDPMKLGGIGGFLGSAWSQIAGTGKVPEPTRSQVIEAAKTAYQGQLEQYLRQADTYKGRARSNGLRPSQVVQYALPEPTPLKRTMTAQDFAKFRRESPGLRQLSDAQVLMYLHEKGVHVLGID